MTAAPLSVDHPGSFIIEELDARGWSQVDLAYILGMSPQQLSPLLTGKQSITPDMATALGEAFDVPAEFFANLQKLYDLQKARRPDPGVRTRASWLSVFPVREMIKRGWIEDGDPALLDLQMTRFFSKDRVEDIPFVGQGDVLPHAARKSNYEATTAVQYAWLHRVKKLAETLDAPDYSKEILRRNLSRIRAHMVDKDDLARIPEILLESGVRFVLVEALAGSKIDGVCVWIDGGKPAIGMTTRLDRMDNFCFVLRHEIEHVLREHGREQTFTPVDEFTYDFSDPSGLPAEEVQANEAATEFLVPRKLVESFIERKSPFISERDVLSFSARLEINPAVVVGQIQHKTKNYAWLRKYQKSIREYLFGWRCIDGWGFTAPTGL
jgi:HTH-type transcriptional regulator/antitoxin HigA